MFAKRINFVALVDENGYLAYCTFTFAALLFIYMSTEQTAINEDNLQDTELSLHQFYDFFNRSSMSATETHLGPWADSSLQLGNDNSSAEGIGLFLLTHRCRTAFDRSRYKPKHI